MSKKYDEKFKNEALGYGKNHLELSINTINRNPENSSLIYFMRKTAKEIKE